MFFGGAARTSSGVDDTETIKFCVSAGSVTFARVHAYPGAPVKKGDYTISGSNSPATCCVNDELEPNNSVAAAKLVMEEGPESYKDVTEVVNTCHDAGISKKAVKLRPIAVVKG